MTKVSNVCKSCKHYAGCGAVCPVSQERQFDDYYCDEWILQRLVSVRDWEGNYCKVKVPEIARKFIPHSWYDLDWHVVVVDRKPRLPNQPFWDQLAFAELQALSIPVVMPVGDVAIGREVVNGKRRRSRKEYQHRLLMPGYLLVGSARNDQSMSDLLSARILCQYVKGAIVTSAGLPWKFRKLEFEAFAESLNSGEYCESITGVRVDNLPHIGQMVEIKDGVFAGQRGPIEKFNDEFTGEDREITGVLVGIQMFGSSMPIKFDVDSVKVIP